MLLGDVRLAPKLAWSRSLSTIVFARGHVVEDVGLDFAALVDEAREAGNRVNPVLVVSQEGDDVCVDTCRLQLRAEAGFHAFYEKASDQEAGDARLDRKLCTTKINKHNMRVGLVVEMRYQVVLFCADSRVPPKVWTRRGLQLTATVTCGNVDTTTHTPFWFRGEPQRCGQLPSRALPVRHNT